MLDFLYLYNEDENKYIYFLQTYKTFFFFKKLFYGYLY